MEGALYILAVVTISMGFFVVKYKSFQRMSGVELVSMSAAIARARRACRKSPKAVRFALWLPIECLAGGFLILGAPRTGKSVLINLFRLSLLKLFADPAEEVLVIDFDPKRENRFWSRFLPTAVPFFDLSPSVEGAGFDLLADCEHDGHVATLADSLIPEIKNDSQPHFRATAVLVLASVLRAARIHGHKLTLRKIVHVCTDLKDLRRYLKSCPGTAAVVTAHLGDGEEAASIFSTLSSAMQRYRTVAAAWDRADRLISVDEFLSLPKAVLNLPYEDDAMAVLVPILRLLLMRLEQKVLMQNKKNRRIIFLLDEYRILREVRFTLLACKGAEAGVTLFYACQSVVGAKEAHGDLVTKELFGLCKNRIFLRVDSIDDAKYISDSMGKQQGYITLNSYGGWSESQATKENAEPGAVMNLPFPSKGKLVIHGFGTTPDTGPFRLKFPFREHTAVLDEAKAAPSLPKRPAAHLDLNPLTPQERRELGL